MGPADSVTCRACEEVEENTIFVVVRLFPGLEFSTYTLRTFEELRNFLSAGRSFLNR